MLHAGLGTPVGLGRAAMPAEQRLNHRCALAARGKTAHPLPQAVPVLPDLTAKQGRGFSVHCGPILLWVGAALCVCPFPPALALLLARAHSAPLHCLLYPSDLCCHQPDSRGCCCPGTRHLPGCVRYWFICVEPHVIYLPRGWQVIL